MILPVLLAQVAAHWAHRPPAPVHGWTPIESEIDMDTQTPMTPERLAEARAALNEDHSQWGSEYGLELINEVGRLQARTTVDDEMVERAARAFYEYPTPGLEVDLRTHWDRLATASPDVAGLYRAHAAAALHAALGSRGDIA